MLEKNRTASDGTLSVAVEPRGRDAGQVHGDQKGGDAARRFFERAGAPEYDGGVGLVRRGDGCFFAIDHVVAADALNAQAQIGRVRAAGRPGQGYGQQRLRSEARRVGKKGVSTGRPRWSP